MRNKNITQDKLSTYRRAFHNPLFNALVNELDRVMHEKGMSDADILKYLYVDERTDMPAVSVKLFDLWTVRSKQITSTDDLANVINESIGFVYLLLGKKGSGKTITLKYFLSRQLEKAGGSRENLNMIYLNLISKQSDREFKDNLPKTLMDDIYYTIKRESKQLFPFLSNPDKIKLVHPEYRYINSNKELLDIINNDKSRALENIFHYLSEKGGETYLIVDNIDDLPILSIKAIIDKCTSLMLTCHIKCIIALRDYWNPQNLRIADRNICSFYLTKPDITKIIKKRFDAINLDSIDYKYDVFANKKLLTTIKPNDIIETYKRIVANINSDNDIQEKLYELANYNTREYLFIIYHFFHSPYLYSKHVFIKEFLETVKQHYKDMEVAPRKLQYFDFIENAMAVHALCYDIDSSRIFNVFYHAYMYYDEAGNNFRNTLIFIRILQQLFPKEQEHEKKRIIMNLRQIGYNEDALKNAIGKLLDVALIESVEGVQEPDIEEILISKKGEKYLELIKEYAYLLYVCDDVPMPGEYNKISLEEKFGTEQIPITRGDLFKKITSVRFFIDFIGEEEKSEEDSCPHDFQDLLIRIRGEYGIAKEMRDSVEDTISKLITPYSIISYNVPKLEFRISED